MCYLYVQEKLKAFCEVQENDLYSQEKTKKNRRGDEVSIQDLIKVYKF